MFRGLILNPRGGEDLLAFLRVSDKWHFEAQKEAAIMEIRLRGRPVELIAAGRQFDEFKRHLVTEFRFLAERCETSPPTEEEGRLLGVADMLRLWHTMLVLKNCRKAGESPDQYLQEMLVDCAHLTTGPYRYEPRVVPITPPGW